VSSYWTEFYIITNYNEKMSMDRHTEEGGWIHSKTSIGLEFADREKGRTTEANLEKDRFEGSRKMRHNMVRG